MRDNRIRSATTRPARFIYRACLKDKLQRELHDARITGKIGDLTELAGIADVRAWQSEMRVVKSVQHVPAQFHSPAFTEVVEVAGKVEIPLHKARAGQR